MKKDLTKVHESKVFEVFIYPVFARDFLLNCDKYEDFAQIIQGHFILTEKQWEAILKEWEIKEDIIDGKMPKF